MDINPDLLIEEQRIAKYLSGETNPEEAIAMEEWISESAANKNLFNQYQEIWNNLRNENKYEVPDTFKAWKYLEENLKDNSTKIKGLSAVRSLFKRYSIAASIIGTIFISAAGLYIYLKSDDNAISKENEILFSTNESIERRFLSDSSEVVLYSNTSLRVPETFVTNTRQINMEGEAYFNVTHNPAKPFIIAIDKIHIQVVGTSFNVKNDTVNGTIETQVRTGKVRMYNDNAEIFIAAGQTGIYNKVNNSFFLKNSVSVNSIGYATRNFVFTDEKLISMISYLEKAYSTKIVLDNPLLGNCKMTSSFENRSIDYVLEVITTTLNLTHSIKNGVIHLGGNHEGC
ncbi:FecR family protein [Ferruginibacter sp.]|nr:FecR family protein [Ferruginibacter sp.]